MTAEADRPGDLRLPERVVPIPQTVSPEAQAYLAQMAAYRAQATYGAETPEQWRAVAAAGNQVMAAHAARTGAGFKGEVRSFREKGVTTYEITPTVIRAENRERALLYVHGGAYLFGGGEIAASMALEHAQAWGGRVVSPDYRMPPDHVFPAALDDVVAAYRRLARETAPANIGVVGLSAGGGLAAAMVHRLRDEGAALPGAVILLSPEADLTEAGDSFRASVFTASFEAISAMYADGRDLKGPYLSPLYGDFTGWPPTLIQSGTRDFFLSSCALMHRRLRQAGVEAELHVWEAMPHGGLGGLSPEDQDVLIEEIRFLDRRLGQA